jgi:hypothetical protein
MESSSSQKRKSDSECNGETKNPRINIDELLKDFEEKTQETDECPICMEETSGLKRLNCSHKMCIGCIRDIINTEGLGKCPFCRVFIKPPSEIRQKKIYQMRALIKSCYHRSPEDKIEINKMLFRLKQLKIEGHDVKMHDILIELYNIMYHPKLSQIIKDLKQVYDL